MNTARPVTTALHGNVHAPAIHALLSLGSRKLLLNQHDIRSLEPIADVIDRSNGPGGNFGWLRFDDRLWPVFALAEDLSVTAKCPPSQNLCALIEESDVHFAVACDGFDMVAEQDLQLYPMPACMTTPRSAIDALAVHGKEVALLCSSAGLADLLSVTADGDE